MWAAGRFVFRDNCVECSPKQFDLIFLFFVSIFLFACSPIRFTWGNLDDDNTQQYYRSTYHYLPERHRSRQNPRHPEYDETSHYALALSCKLHALHISEILLQFAPNHLLMLMCCVTQVSNRWHIFTHYITCRLTRHTRTYNKHNYNEFTTSQTTSFLNKHNVVLSIQLQMVIRPHDIVFIEAPHCLLPFAGYTTQRQSPKVSTTGPSIYSYDLISGKSR